MSKCPHGMMSWECPDCSPSRQEIREAELVSRVERLERALSEAMEWNWLDEDAPDIDEFLENYKENK